MTRRGDRGFALLLVLVALATLSLIVAASVDAANRHARQSSAELDRVRLGAAMDAALVTVAHDLAEAGAAAPAVLSHAVSYEISGIAVAVEVKPETGRLDLNAAPPEAIEALLASSGIAPELARKLAQEVADWRDGDSDARKDGAEASDYIMAGRSYVPTNRAFETVSELGMMLDGGEDLVTCLEPDLTVFTRSADIDPNFASARLRRALQAAGAAQRPASTSVIGGRVVSSSTIFDVAMSARDPRSGRHALSHVVIRITGSPSDPLWILSRKLAQPDGRYAEAACRRLAHRGG